MNFLQRQWSAKRRILATAKQVREQTGKSVTAQLGEMTLLRLGEGQLSAEDYFRVAVYDSRLRSRTVRGEVVSWHPSRLANALNDPALSAVCHDKLAYHHFLQRLGLPAPSVLAAYVEGATAAGDIHLLHTPHDLVTFLRSGMSYPFFGKPIFGQYGRGVSWVTAYLPEEDRLAFITGEEIGVEDYVREYVLAEKRGYIFQEPLAQHPDVNRMVGERVASLRVVILRGDDGPELFRVVWRIPVGQSITDNFQHGTQGNLVAEIDPATGRVVRVVQVRSGNERLLPLPVELERHPDTGVELRHALLPDWETHMAVCLRAATALPGLRYQSWDLVMGATGPVLLELNFRGGIDVLQIAGGKGLLDAQFRSFWSQYASRD